jgi:uncharacterized protein YpmS
MRRLIKALLLFIFLITVLILILVVDLSPSVKANSGEQVDNAESVQSLIGELKQSLRSRYDPQVVNISVAQADSLSGFIHRAVNKANAVVVFSDKQIKVSISYELNKSIIPLYLNLVAYIDEGEGMKVDRVSLGDLTLPGSFALDVAESLANTYTSSEVATKAIATVDSVDIKTSGASVQLKPLDNLLREFKNIQTGGSSEDTKILKIRIAHYLRLLDGLYIPPSANSPANRKAGQSLSYYLHAVMKEAKALSPQSSATLENEAAILAVAIYAGSWRFTAFVGDLSFAIERIPTASPKPVLADRRDLSLHFIFSAAIKLLSEKGVSIAVGEFKELMDRGRGGSGYSFVDLAADLSGAHFADLAVNPETAKYLQEVMSAAPNEDLFMVPIQGLEEGLSKAEFENKYTKVDSDKYKEVVVEIEQRIAALAVSN